MTTIKLYAHMIAPIPETGVGPIQFKAVDIVTNVAHMLATMYDGKASSAHVGVIQDDDTVYIDRILSDEEKTLITTAFPFVTIRENDLSV